MIDPSFGVRAEERDFYTFIPAECAAVKADSSWQFESNTFYVEVSTGYGNGNGACPAGTVPLYRAYNDGGGGAPNHRYTTTLTTLTSMVLRGGRSTASRTPGPSPASRSDPCGIRSS